MHEEFVANHVPKAAAVYERPNGSLTAEAAMALPILILGVFTILVWMTFFTKISEELIKQNKRAREFAETVYLFNYTSTDIRLFTYGVSGILTTDLPKRDRLLLISRTRPFTGSYYEKETDNDGEEEEYVYVAETGSVYHTTESCTHLKLSIKEVPYSSISGLRNQYGEKYHRCEICGGKAVGDTVWITSEGNRFHSDINCSGLKRTVSRITISEAEARGLRKCTRCGR